MADRGSSRFQVGGSISEQTSIYIPRKADGQLFDALLQGELCYVFNSRQVGKSSLLLNVKTRLQQQGARCCFLDMSRIGSVNVTDQQWYAGIISELWRGFELPSGKAMLGWWQSLGDITPAQKLGDFFQNYLLHTYPDQQLIIFFDEVDSVLSLPFAADDFFSVIRACYNLRADDAEMGRLRFAFFGVALPSDLVSDARRSPFNIGRAIAMEGFTLAEAMPLASGLQCPGYEAEQLLAAIIHWSGGQPFLTQKLCQLVNDSASDNSRVDGMDERAWVDMLVAQRVLDDWESRDNPEHLRTIRDRMLLDENYSMVNLAGYAQLLASPAERLDVKAAGDYSRLYLTGLVAVEQGQLRPRTEIYRRVFGERWLQQQLDARRPYAKQLRQWQQQAEEHCLLQGDELQLAKAWAEGKHLPEADYRFIAASQALAQRQVQDWNERLQAEIAQRQLAEAEAEQANRAKSDFLARVSREVRTPINSVLGLSYLALQREQSDTGRDYLQKIHRATSHMLGVVNDMVDISKVERGELSLQSQTFFIDDVLDNLVDMMAAGIHGKGLQFHLHMPQQLLPPLLGDANRLQQLLLNLASNALQHTEAGTIELRVELQACEADSLNLAFTLCDSGSGIGEQPVQGVVDKSEQSVLQPGLGLSLCCELVKLMGGELTVDSQPSRGCCMAFQARFMLAKPLEPSAVQPLQIAVAATEANAKHWSQRLACLGHEVLLLPASLEAVDLESCDKLLVEPAALATPGQLIALVDRYPNLEIHPLLSIGEVLPHWLIILELQPALTAPASLMRIIAGLADSGKRWQGSSVLPQFPSRYRVLVAEDDEINQQIVTELLEQQGLAVTVVGDGDKALSALKSALNTNPYDLILMDIEMPVMGGLEAVRVLRELGQSTKFEALATLPVIAMTAHALVDDRKRFLSAGMSDHLSKPLQPALLSQLLNQYLPETAEGDSLPEAVVGLAFVDIYGIDSAAGIERCGGNSALYLKLLNKFAQRYQEGVAFQLMGEGALIEFCHSIKGSASNLGLMVIADAAAELEVLARSEQPPSVEDLHGFSLLLKKRCQQLLQLSESSALNGRLGSPLTEATSAEVKGGVKPALLLVAPQLSVLKPLIEQLKNDYKLIVAADADRALQLLLKHDFQAALIACELASPNDGLVLCQAIRATAKGAELPLLMSGLDNNEPLYQQALAAGVTDFLPSPVSYTLLRLRLESQ